MQIVPAGNASAWTGPGGNNTYLIEGRVPTLVDAGVGAPEHVDAVARLLQGAALAQVLITHGHSDHASGLPALSARWPGIQVLALGPVAPAARRLRDGEVVAAGNATLHVIATPGHAPDHACFLDPEHGDLYCGDLVREGGSIVVGASRGGDVAEYLDSLRRVRNLAPSRILPGHGPVIENPGSVLDRFIRHRLDRESQVLGALTDRPQTPEALVAAIYADLSPELEAAAADTVLAHLRHLSRTGLAVESGAGWIRVHHR